MSARSEFNILKRVSTIEDSDEILFSREPSKNLRKFSESVDIASRLNRKSLETPLFNLFGRCPTCKSKKYKKLFGGEHNKYCINCLTPYD